MSNNFQTRITSIIEVLSKAIMAEISKVFDLYSLEISRDENEEKVPNKLLLMAQFSTVMDTLAEEAVNKICTLASEECLGLCLEVSPCQTEIGYLRRKLELMEKELRTAQGGGAGERPSVGVQFADMEEAGPLSAVVKVEKTEDCCDPREGYKVSGEGPAKHSSDCGEEPPVESCVEACAEGSEEQGTRRTATDSNSNIADVTRNTKETRRASKREKRISSWRSSSKRLDPDTLQVGDLEKPFRCTECEKTFATKRSLYKHSVIHTERKYNCLKCGKRFHLRRSLKSHQFVHGAEKPFCCLICGKGFTVRYSLKVHQRIHTGAKPYSCDTCGKSFHQGSSLKKHHSVHTGEKQYACDMKFEDVEEAGPVSVVVKEENIEDCSEQGPAKHSSDCGEEPPVESCVEACAESTEGRGEQYPATDSNSNIADANRNAKEKTRASKRENRLSSWRSSSKRLDADTLQVGDLGKAFRCTECEKTFATKRGLYQHNLIHTEKKYNCLKCGKSFHQMRSLRSHQFVHGAETPFCCLICGKGFSVRYNLNVHQRIHTGAKPYSCGTCGKSFNRRSNLKKHQKVHTGEKRYSRGTKFEDVEEAGPVSVVVKEENIEDCSDPQQGCKIGECYDL